MDRTQLPIWKKFYFIDCAYSARQHDRDNGVGAWGYRFSQT